MHKSSKNVVFFNRIIKTVKNTVFPVGAALVFGTAVLKGLLMSCTFYNFLGD